MNRETVEKMIREFGSGSPEFKGRLFEARHKENCIIYQTEQKYGDPLNVIINGVSLYADNRHYLKLEVDDWGLVVRLYYEHHYVGCVVENWEDLNSFRFR